jgi:hypothetical protein
VICDARLSGEVVSTQKEKAQYTNQAFQLEI